MAQHPILERYLWFDTQIRKGQYPNAERLAERFELCRKTAQRDIAFLRDRLDAPLEYDPAQHGYRYTEDAYRLPPLHATENQLLALLLSRHLLRAGGGHLDCDLEAFTATLFSAVADRRLSPARLDDLFSAVWSGHSPVEETIFRPVLATLTQNRLLVIRYRSPRAPGMTERTVEPHHLQHYSGSWVLLAWCRKAKAWRKFYLSRMETAQPSPETFAPRPPESWRPQLEGAYGIFQGNRIVRVRLRFCAERARWIRNQLWHEKQRIVPLPDGGLELHLPVADLREIRLKVLQFGADVEVLEPDALREWIRGEIARMSELYEEEAEASRPLRRMLPEATSSLAVAERSAQRL